MFKYEIEVLSKNLSSIYKSEIYGYKWAKIYAIFESMTNQTF